MSYSNVSYLNFTTELTEKVVVSPTIATICREQLELDV